MKTFTAEATHLGISTIEEAKEIIGSWNGKDETFYHNGSMYHEDDVSLLEEIISE